MLREKKSQSPVCSEPEERLSAVVQKSWWHCSGTAKSSPSRARNDTVCVTIAAFCRLGFLAKVNTKRLSTQILQSRIRSYPSTEIQRLEGWPRPSHKAGAILRRPDNGNLASLKIILLARVPTARSNKKMREELPARLSSTETSDVRYVRISSRNGTQNTTAIQIMVRAMPSATKLIGHCAMKTPKFAAVRHQLSTHY